MGSPFDPPTEGIIIRNAQLLLTHAKGAPYTFLPGGPIEPAETTAAALAREIKEEAGHDAIAAKFIGCLETSFMDSGVRNFEINHVFLVEAPTLASTLHPGSQENHLELMWVPISDLGRHNLLPRPLVDLLQQVDLDAISFW